MIPELNKLLCKVVENGGSDLHLKHNNINEKMMLCPYYRVDGILYAMPDDFINDANCSIAEAWSIKLLAGNDVQLKNFNNRGDADISYHFRYNQKLINSRMNIFKDINGYAFAFRIIASEIPSAEDLLIPYSVQELIKENHGLILICGPTGSGKTTTLASLIKKISNTAAKHIITIEEPVEYEYKGTTSIISQREIGTHCDCFSNGLKAALREDPDIILVGEMRDNETIATALAASETGHLVLSSIHCDNVKEVVDRLVQYFPESEQQQIRSEFANSFKAVVAQRLYKKRGGGRVACFEVMLNTPAIANVIRTGQTFALYDYMYKKDGMQTMEESYKELQLRKFIE